MRFSRVKLDAGLISTEVLLESLTTREAVEIVCGRSGENQRTLYINRAQLAAFPLFRAHLEKKRGHRIVFINQCPDAFELFLRFVVQGLPREGDESFAKTKDPILIAKVLVLLRTWVNTNEPIEEMTKHLSNLLEIKEKITDAARLNDMAAMYADCYSLLRNYDLRLIPIHAIVCERWGQSRLSFGRLVSGLSDDACADIARFESLLARADGEETAVFPFWKRVEFFEHQTQSLLPLLFKPTAGWPSWLGESLISANPDADPFKLLRDFLELENTRRGRRRTLRY